MANKQKIDKDKQKQHDKAFKDAVDDFDRFEDFFSTNLKQILIGFCVLSVAIVIAAIAYTKITKAQLKVSGKLTAAKTVEELKKEIAEYSSNDSVYPARMRLATLYFNDGKYEEALTEYTGLGADAPPGEIKNRARLNEAYTLEALKRGKEAAEKFAAIGETIGEDVKVPEYIRNEANFSAGRIYLAEKQPEKAKQCLKAINFDAPGLWASQGEKLLQRID